MYRCLTGFSYVYPFFTVLHLVLLIQGRYSMDSALYIRCSQNLIVVLLIRCLMALALFIRFSVELVLYSTVHPLLSGFSSVHPLHTGSDPNGNTLFAKQCSLMIENVKIRKFIHLLVKLYNFDISKTFRSYSSFVFSMLSSLFYLYTFYL